MIAFLDDDALRWRRVIFGEATVEGASRLQGYTALAMTVALAILAFTVPALWTLSSDTGGIKATLASIDKRLDGFEKLLEGLHDKLDRADRTLASIDLRLVAKETDPILTVAQSGLRPEAEFGAVKVGPKVYVLPKSDKAAEFLDKAGLPREAITPSAFGYVIGTVNDQGRFTGTRTVIRPE